MKKKKKQEPPPSKRIPSLEIPCRILALTFRMSFWITMLGSHNQNTQSELFFLACEHMFMFVPAHTDLFPCWQCWVLLFGELAFSYVLGQTPTRRGWWNSNNSDAILQAGRWSFSSLHKSKSVQPPCRGTPVRGSLPESSACSSFLWGARSKVRNFTPYTFGTVLESPGFWFLENNSTKCFCDNLSI